MVSWMALPEPQASRHALISWRTASLIFFCPMLTCDVSLLPRPEHSLADGKPGREHLQPQRDHWTWRFPSHTLCLDPFRIKLFSFSASIRSQLQPSHPALFMATCSSIQPYLFVSLQWALAKPLSFKALHFSLISSPSPSLHVLFTFTPVPSHQTCQPSKHTLYLLPPCFFSCSFSPPSAYPPFSVVLLFCWKSVCFIIFLLLLL